MAILRAQAVFQTPSGLAKDKIVNTFHFEGPSDSGSWATIANSVRAFYESGTGITGGSPVGSFLSSILKTLDVFVYEVPGILGENGRELPSGPPVWADLGVANQFGSMSRQNPTNMPNEVAVCVSYQGTPAPGVVQSRRRGRIYFGPLNLAARADGTDGPRPSSTLTSRLGEAYSRLTADVDPEVEAVIYSRPFAGRALVPRVDRPDLPALAPRPGTTVGIDQLWVDDEFDTQRSRGLRRTGRTMVTAAG